MTLSKVRRPEIGSVALSAIAAAYLLLATNNSFWIHAGNYFGASKLSLLVFGAALYLALFSILIPMSIKYLMKPALIFFILVSASASYFADVFGVIIDRDMIGSAVVTTPAEASHLLTGSLAQHLVVYALFPSLIVAWVKVRHRRFLPKFTVNFLFVTVALFAAGGLIYSNFATFAYVLREHGSDEKVQSHRAACRGGTLRPVDLSGAQSCRPTTRHRRTPRRPYCASRKARGRCRRCG